jgi:pimeloyl-ACP methyl ester carboxylesterase
MKLDSDSSVAQHWQYHELMPGKAGYFRESFENYDLEGRVLFAKDEHWPQILFIHGARSDYTEMNALLTAMQQQGVSTLSFNMSGHNRCSSVSVYQTSLQQNLQEAESFYRHLQADMPHTVMGHSLGGALAVKLAVRFPEKINRLVLFCPAVYADAAYPVHFGRDFTQAISSPFSFLNSEIFAYLKKFTGKLVLIMGEYDGLPSKNFDKPAGVSAGEIDIGGQKKYSPIPFEVVEQIKTAITKERFLSLLIPDCDHDIAGWLRQNPENCNELVKKILSFCQS